jgi:hypothetical protein
MSVTVTLAKPIEAHGETLSQLTMREPTGKDIRINGMPFRFHADDGTIVTDAASVHRYIAALAAVPPSAVDRLAPIDWASAMSAVLGFFGQAPTAS